MASILIAEDDDEQRKSLVELIREKNDIEILEARNLTDALAIIEKTRDHLVLVITDMCMPNHGDGNKVAAKALEYGITVIILTGIPENVDKSIKEKCTILTKSDLKAIGQLIGIVESKCATKKP